MDLQRCGFKKIFIKGLCTGFTCALALSFAQISAKASDYDYFGAVDHFTGEPADESYYAQDEDGSEEGVKKVWISDTCYFDYEKDCYVYPVDEQGGEIYCSVADGMIVQNNVAFSATENVSPTVYLNGYVIDHANGEFNAEGSYLVVIINGGEETQILSFTICGEVTNYVTGYNMPEGFAINYASLNGEETGYSGDFVDMSEEGRYYVSYECYMTDRDYALNLTVDLTTPTLTFEGLGENNKARGPVNIVKDDPEASVSITRDGKEMDLVLSYVLTQSGRYVVRATDPAGNFTEYQFIIMIYLNRYGVILLILIVLIVIAVVAYVYYTRTHLKTR